VTVTPVTLPTVVCDASIALKWFHEQGEDEVDAARALLTAFVTRRIDVLLIDLTPYELGNALVRGVEVAPGAVATVLEALGEITTPVTPTSAEQSLAAHLASSHRLTYYDAAYAAVAQHRHAGLATMDRALLDAGLGRRPADILAGLG
jgi:predicted nucleic acid-binding protein